MNKNPNKDIMSDLENIKAESAGQEPEFCEEVQAELRNIVGAATENAKSHSKKFEGNKKQFSNHEELNKLKEEKTQLNEALIRAIADNENLRKRYEKQIEDTAKFAISSFLKDLLPAIDNLHRASESIPQDRLTESDLLVKILDGLIITQKSFTDIFAKHGLIRVAPKAGDSFDHNLHQAVVNVESQEIAPGMIVACMQPGYELAGRLIRAAMVSVSKKN
jgi:molecular chaperone GrpE